MRDHICGLASLLCCFSATPDWASAADVVAPRRDPVVITPTQPPPGGAFGCGGRCAATLLIGPQLTSDMDRVFGIGENPSYVPPWRYNFGDSWFAGGALSYRVLGNAEVASIEFEAGVGQRFGSLHQTEGWVALYGRWSYFPWNSLVRTSIAISTGLNYASSATEHEIALTSGNVSSRLLHYLAPEITFAAPDVPNTELVIRLHHRSGGGKWWDDDVPVYGSWFKGNRGGTQYLTAGIRQRF